MKPLLLTLAMMSTLAKDSSLHASPSTQLADLDETTYTIQITTIDLNAKVCRGLIKKHLGNDRSLYQAFHQLITQDKATVVNIFSTKVNNGEVAHLVSGQQYIYPTEGGSCGLSPHSIPKNIIPLLGTQNIAMAVGPGFSAFEERQLGSDLTLLCSKQSEKSVRLGLSFTDTSHSKTNTFREWKDQFGHSNNQMPEFYKNEVQSDIIIPLKSTILLSIQTPRDLKGNPSPTRKLALFAKVRKSN